MPNSFSNIIFLSLSLSVSVFQSLSVSASVTRYKSPNVYKSCPKMISLEKLMILTPFQKLYNNVVDLGKIIVAPSFECLPKVQKITQSGHTGGCYILFFFLNGPYSEFRISFLNNS